MNKLRVIILLIMTGFVAIGSPMPEPVLAADSVDISSGGASTITGSLGGSITGSSALTANLVVTVNFGELSPINTNPMVKAVVPVSVRSSTRYQVTASISGAIDPDPNSVQLSDIGFGVQNFRPLGNKASPCGVNSVITALFNNDPSATVFINANGRAAYPSSLANIATPAVVLTGPELSKGKNVSPRDNNGYAFDAVLTVAPQFFKPGSVTLTLVLRIELLPGPDC